MKVAEDGWSSLVENDKDMSAIFVLHCAVS